MKNTEEFMSNVSEKDIGKEVVIGEDVYLLDLPSFQWTECQLFRMEINPNSSETKHGDVGVVGEILYTGQAKDDDREIKAVECLSQKHYDKSLIRYLRHVRSVKLYGGEVK